MELNDPVIVEAGKWFKKLNNPSSAMFHLARTRRENLASGCESLEVTKQFKKTSDNRMRGLVDAVDEMKQP